jgi:hypothetical protein
MTLLDAVEAAISNVEKARARVRRGRSLQVTVVDEIDFLKALAYAWFNTHRPSIEGQVADTHVIAVDEEFRAVMEATARASARSTYVDALRRAKEALVDLRAETLIPKPVKSGATPVPDFSPLAADQLMRDILIRRWKECEACLQVGACLAATVMMGGLLEALFVARANKMTDKRALFISKSTPIDKKTQKPLQLGEWTLRPYLDVGAEIGWITKPAKEVGTVLRDYRNYVHPEKERVHGITLNSHDAAMFWELTKSLCYQLVAS